MIDPASLHVTAINTEIGSLGWSFAVELCRAKGIDPDHMAPGNPFGLPNWRAEIYRVLLETGMEIAVRNRN